MKASISLTQAELSKHLTAAQALVPALKRVKGLNVTLTASGDVQIDSPDGEPLDLEFELTVAP